MRRSDVFLAVTGLLVCGGCGGSAKPEPPRVRLRRLARRSCWSRWTRRAPTRSGLTRKASRPRPSTRLPRVAADSARPTRRFPRRCRRSPRSGCDRPGTGRRPSFRRSCWRGASGSLAASTSTTTACRRRASSEAPARRPTARSNTWIASRRGRSSCGLTTTTRTRRTRRRSPSPAATRTRTSAKWRRSTSSWGVSRRLSSAEDRQKLASLGYVSAGMAPLVRQGAPRPAAMTRLFESIEKASGLFVTERYAEVIPLLQKILRDDPGNLAAHLRLATAHSALGNEQSRSSRAGDSRRPSASGAGRRAACRP